MEARKLVIRLLSTPYIYKGPLPAHTKYFSGHSIR